MRRYTRPSRVALNSLLEILTPGGLHGHAAALHGLDQRAEHLRRHAHGGPAQAGDELLRLLLLAGGEELLLAPQALVDCFPEAVIEGVEVRGALRQLEDVDIALPLRLLTVEIFC